MDGDQPFHLLDRLRSARQNLQKIGCAIEIEPHDRGADALFHEELAGLDRRRLDDRHFLDRETEQTAIDVVIGLRVRQENVEGRLLNQGRGDGRLAHVLRFLRADADDPVLLANGLHRVLDEIFEHAIVEQLPGFIEEDEGGRAVQRLLDPVKDVEERCRSQVRGVENLGHVETDDIRLRPVHEIDWIVEQPAVGLFVDPWGKARPETLEPALQLPAQ